MDDYRPEQPHSPTIFGDGVDVSRIFKNVRIDGALKKSKKKNNEEDCNEYRDSSEREVQLKLNAGGKWNIGEKDFVKYISERATNIESNQAAKFLKINAAVCRKSSTSSLPPIEEVAAFGSITIPIKKVSFSDIPLSPQKLSQIGR